MGPGLQVHGALVRRRAPHGLAQPLLQGASCLKEEAVFGVLPSPAPLGTHSRGRGPASG